MSSSKEVICGSEQESDSANNFSTDDDFLDFSLTSSSWCGGSTSPSSDFTLHASYFISTENSNTHSDESESSSINQPTGSSNSDFTSSNTKEEDSIHRNNSNLGFSQHEKGDDRDFYDKFTEDLVYAYGEGRKNYILSSRECPADQGNTDFNFTGHKKDDNDRKCMDYEVSDFLSNMLAQNRDDYVLSSGRVLQQETKEELTIDKEFEQYFSAFLP